MLKNIAIVVTGITASAAILAGVNKLLDSNWANDIVDYVPGPGEGTDPVEDAKSDGVPDSE